MAATVFAHDGFSRLLFRTLVYVLQSQYSAKPVTEFRAWQLEGRSTLTSHVSAIPIIFIFIGLFYQWRQRIRLDPLTREYHALQDTFKSSTFRYKHRIL